MVDGAQRVPLCCRCEPSGSSDVEWLAGAGQDGGDDVGVAGVEVDESDRSQLFSSFPVVLILLLGCVDLGVDASVDFLV